MTSIVDSTEVGLVAVLNLLHFSRVTRDMHYGQWSHDLEVSIPRLPEAQKRNFDFLIGHIAEGVKPVLDVCCGAGGVALKWLARDYAESFVHFKVYRLLLLGMPEQ